MAYSRTKTWANGDTLTGTDLQANLDGMKEYVHCEVVAGDFPSVSFDTEHIMKGVIDAKTNRVHNVSGIFGGLNHGNARDNDNTFMSRWQSTDDSAKATGQMKKLPGTQFTLDLRRPATVFYQWWATTVSRWDGRGALPDAQPTNLQLFQDDTMFGATAYLFDIFSGESTMYNPTAGTYHDGNIFASGSTHTSGTGFFEATTGKVAYNLGIKAHSKAGAYHWVSWGISIEAFYM